MDPELSITSADQDSVPAYKRIRWRLWLFIASPFLFMGACSIILFHAKSAYLPAAIAASTRLHEQLAHGWEGQIYVDADPAFRAALPANTTLAFLARLRRKLGVCEYSGPTGWNVNSNSSGTFVTVVYHEQCANGAGDETLQWSIYDGAAHLMSINVNSPLLLTD
jgi:hypothetical protein